MTLFHGELKPNYTRQHQTATGLEDLPSPDSSETEVYMIVTLDTVTATRLGREKRVCALVLHFQIEQVVFC